MGAWRRAPGAQSVFLEPRTSLLVPSSFPGFILESMAARRSRSSGNMLGRLMLLGMWVAVAGVLALGFDSWLDRQQNPNRELQTVVASDGAREVSLERNRNGHYIAEGTINGHAVKFMLDTGASDISIPEAVAKEIGLERGQPMQYRTANGMITAFTTQLDLVTLGGLEQHDIRGSINPYMDGDHILLGMSFLGDLDFRQSGGVLTLTQY